MIGFTKKFIGLAILIVILLAGCSMNKEDQRSRYETHSNTKTSDREIPYNLEELKVNTLPPNLEENFVEYAYSSSLSRGTIRFSGIKKINLNNNQNWLQLMTETSGEGKDPSGNNNRWYPFEKINGTSLFVNTENGKFAEKKEEEINILDHYETENLFLPFYTWMLSLEDNFVLKTYIKKEYQAFTSERDIIYKVKEKTIFKGREVFLVEKMHTDPKDGKITQKTEYVIDEKTRIILSLKVTEDDGKISREHTLIKTSLFNLQEK